jgi:glyoxylase-like metal-dependent hydrolase (beta-lactamase superfamily II)
VPIRRHSGANFAKEVPMPDAQIYRVGAAEVTRVQEYMLDNFTPEMLLPEWRPERQTAPDDISSAAMAPDGEHVLLSIHTWVVRDRGRTILIDTGAGNDKPRPYARYFDHLNAPYLERLAAIGVSPEKVDYVLLTHLHVDHVGWNTRLVDDRWTPTFPNARYVFSREEHRFFTEPRTTTSATGPASRCSSTASIR